MSEPRRGSTAPRNTNNYERSKSKMAEERNIYKNPTKENRQKATSFESIQNLNSEENIYQPTGKIKRDHNKRAENLFRKCP